MFNTIEKWRNKSERERRMLAFVISLAITLVIAAVWATVFFPNSKKEIAAEKIKAPGESPISILRKNTAQSFQIIKDQFSSVKDAFKKTEDVYEAGSNASKSYDEPPQFTP